MGKGCCDHEKGHYGKYTGNHPHTTQNTINTDIHM